MPTAAASSAVSTGETAMSSAESPAVIRVRPSVHSSWYAAEAERAHQEQLCARARPGQPDRARSASEQDAAA